MFFCDTLKAENIRLKNENIQKDIVVDNLTHEIEQLKVKYDNLKFARSFSSDQYEDKSEAKKKLSKLVRDIDKCITMLKN